MESQDITSSKQPPTGARVPPLGLSAEPLCFRLHLRAGRGEGPEAGEDPFVGLDSGPLPFKAYLAALESDHQPVVPHLALLLSPNEYSGVRGTDGATNVQMEELWRTALASWGADLPVGVARLEVKALPGNAPPAQVPSVGPLAYCRKTQEYIEPVCPACLGRLTVCRDETLLRTSGLPSFAGTLSRFLYCPACVAETGRAPAFYAYAARPVESLAQGVRLRIRTELYRDLATRIQVGQKPAGMAHHCFECPHRATCYPTGRNIEDRVPAEDLLFPLAYFGAFYLPVQPGIFEFGETAALLGGAIPEDLQSSGPAARPGDNPLRDAGLAALAFDRPQFFFSGDPTGLFALEALHLKLSAFADLARGLRDLHARAERPYLALSPERLRGGLPEAPDATLPARWRLWLKLGDLITTAPLAGPERAGAAGEPVVWSIPCPLPEAFVPGALSRRQSESLFMRVSAGELRVETTPGGAVARLTAELAADGYREGEHGRHDLVRLVADTGRGEGGRLVFTGRKAASTARGFQFVGATGPLADGAATGIDPARVGSWSVEATIVHSFGAPADVASAGLILMRLLLHNDRLDTARLDLDTLGRLAEAVAAAAGADEPGRRTALAEAMRRETLEAGAEQVLHRQADRAHARPETLETLWLDALLLAVRMGSNIPGFSICARLDDYDASDPAAPMRRVVEELEMLVERARGGLIGSSGRNGIVQEVCDDFLADVKEALAAPAEDVAGKTILIAQPRKRA